MIEPERWQAALQGEVEYLASLGALQEATDLLVRRLERSLFEPKPDARGPVSLVGAGPGAAELLTLRAVERLRAADVGRPRSAGQRRRPRACTRRAPSAFDVGRRHRSPAAPTQAEINTLLVDLAREGRRVVRLKGGDPFVFGRGGEEVLALTKAGVDFEVVPGISSALAPPAAAGIPVAHRGLSASVTVVNGHEAIQHDWNRPRTRRRHAGVPDGRGDLEGSWSAARAWPFLKRATAMIEWATLPRQRVLAAPLAEIAAQARLVVRAAVRARRRSDRGARRRARARPAARAASQRELVAS